MCVALPMIVLSTDGVSAVVEGCGERRVVGTLLVGEVTRLLHDALGTGPVRGTARAYGACHVSLTTRARIWSVQYTNAMGAIILDTLEIGDVPVALRAAPEDLEDSGARVAELLEAYRR